MKTLPYVALTLALAAASSSAQILTETYNFTVGSPTGLISDQGVPSTFSQTISGSQINSITEVRVALHLVGSPTGEGWAGDMYVSLVRSGNGDQTSILLNQVGATPSQTEGFGFDGWNITFRDSAANGDVHLGQPTFPATILTGEWQPDGRQNPLSSSRTAPLSVFNTLGANTTWHFTVADLQEQGTMVLESWSLVISGTVVPEPGTWAAITAGSLCAFAAIRRRIQRR